MSFVPECSSYCIHMAKSSVGFLSCMFFFIPDRKQRWCKFLYIKYIQGCTLTVPSKASSFHVRVTRTLIAIYLFCRWHSHRDSIYLFLDPACTSYLILGSHFLSWDFNYMYHMYNSTWDPTYPTRDHNFPTRDPNFPTRDPN